MDETTARRFSLRVAAIVSAFLAIASCGSEAMDARGSAATAAAACEPYELDCTNGLDDDCDGLVDAADPDCAYDCWWDGCPSGWSCGWDHSCHQDSCHDGVQDGDETGVDCGGAMCGARCAAGQHCGTTSDCVASASCLDGVCTESSPPPPDTAITGLLDASGTPIAGGLTLSTTAIVEFAAAPAENVASFECSLDAAAFAACVSPVRYDALPLGTHTFAVRAVNTAGTADPTPALAAVTIEAAPITTVIGASDGTGRAVTNGGGTRSRELTFQFTGTDNGQIVQFRCALDGASPSSCTSPTTYRRLARSTHAFRVHAVDDRGIAGADATWTWTVQ
jgi:hypothetical protein